MNVTSPPDHYSSVESSGPNLDRLVHVTTSVWQLAMRDRHLFDSRFLPQELTGEIDHASQLKALLEFVQPETADAAWARYAS